ncbi:MAG TPA: hypothetical protein VGF74_18885 [Thermoleophilaceae bacterium]
MAAQITLITVPQEFARLCNAVLAADHGDDFHPVDDDRPDRGNDGYLKSEKRLFAMHCFKRVQNQSIDAAVRSKMLGDLGKAIVLTEEGRWNIEAWTFISNYPVSEEIAAQIVKVGEQSGIDVSWRGPDYLADGLQRNKSIRAAFPSLQTNELGERIEALQQDLGTLMMSVDKASGGAGSMEHGIQTTDEGRERLLEERPGGWEYLYLASLLDQGKRGLELKWREHGAGAPAWSRDRLDDDEAMDYLQRRFGEIKIEIAVMMTVFDPTSQVEAFGAPGEAGNPIGIEHFARRVLAGYEYFLDWAARLRGADVGDTFRALFEVTASLATEPASQIRAFIETLVSETARIPAYLADEDPNKAPLSIEVSLVLSIDDEAIDAYQSEMRAVEEAILERP